MAPRPVISDSFSFTRDEAKYALPSASQGVTRSRLLDRMKQAGTARLVVVTAPAGFGKSTTLAQFADADPRHVAWLSVDHLDNDPVALLRHLAVTLDRLEAVPADVVELLNAASVDLERVVLPRFGNMLLGRQTPFVVILDDAHLLTSERSVDVLQSVVAHLPAGSQLVLGSRTQPPLNIARMRLDDQVAEFDWHDLALDPDEAYLALAASGVSTTVEQAEELVRRTDGWPAGLRFVILANRSAGSLHQSPAVVPGNERRVAAYLRTEILSDLDDDDLQFLLRSSVLTRMSGPLCDKVLERTGSRAMLERLAATGMFVIPLDSTGEWYRYHHMFAELLQAELNAADARTAAELHRRASDVLLADDDVDGAIRHALAGGQVELAGNLVLQHALAWGSRGRNATVGLWLELFDLDTIQSSPPLALAMAAYCTGGGDIASVEQWLELADTDDETPLSDGSPSAHVAVAALRAVIGLDGLDHLFKHTETVRNAGAVGNPWWGMATQIQGMGLLCMGQLDAASATLREAEAATLTQLPSYAVCQANLAILDIEDGDWEEAERRVATSRRVISDNGLWEYLPVVPSMAVGSLVYAHRNDQQSSREMAARTRAGLDSLGHVSPRARLVGLVQLARAYALLGDLDLARNTMVEARRVLAREPAARLMRQHLDALEEQIGAEAADAPVVVESPDLLVQLTAAELRVLELLPTHLTLREIGDQLFVSRNTVKSQAIAVYRKLGVSTRSSAVQRARDLRLLATD
ncbi:LuxR C-terminal-related transcriptional regulator [soil metagenome]